MYMKKIVMVVCVVLLFNVFGCTKSEPVVPNKILPPTDVKPAEPVEPQETCNDGIKNQGEMEVDCGGPCAECPPKESCDDGILNQDETDVDCGGLCKPCPVEKYEISADNLAKLKDKLTQGTTATLLYPSYPTGLKSGESYVFALGVTNTLRKETNFRLSLKFKEAKDLQNNPINVDKDYIMRWFDKNDFETWTLGDYEQKFIPIGVTVGDNIAADKSVVPGNYEFELLIEKQDTKVVWNEFAKKSFTFRVK